MKDEIFKKFILDAYKKSSEGNLVGILYNAVSTYGFSDIKDIDGFVRNYNPDIYLDMTGIAFSGSKRQVNNDNRFKFCPKCGRELTKEDFGGVDFGDKPDMREKIKEYISELDVEINKLEFDLEKQMTYNVEACKVSATESRLNAIIEVKNDLLGRLKDVMG